MNLGLIPISIGVSRLILPMFALGPDPGAGIGKLTEEIIAKQ